MRPLSVLVIDDDAGDRKLVSRLLSKCQEQVDVTQVERATDVTALTDRNFDAIFCDNNLPGQLGVDLVPVMRETWPRAAIILMTGQGDAVLAKSAILSGATDYVPKGALSQNAVQRMLTNGVRTARELSRIEEQRQDLALFAEVIVHDFKAPIRALSFLAEQIAEDLASGDLEEVRSGVCRISKSARQMSSMIESLADHVRLDRETDFQPHAAQDIVGCALDMLATEIAESAAKVSVHVGPDLPPITCDGAKISQTIQNLVANSLKFAGDQVPEVEVKVAQAEVGYVEFLVSDNGIGIPDTYRERVFAPFKRIPGRSEINGSGLGLATCKKNVMLHEGTISCENSDLGGTAFRLSIPAHRQSLADH